MPVYDIKVALMVEAETENDAMDAVEYALVLGFSDDDSFEGSYFLFAKLADDECQRKES